MIDNYERITMPYSLDVSSATYDVLGAIGEQTAEEAGLEKGFSCNETYDEIYAGHRHVTVHIDGGSESDAYHALEELEGKTGSLGIHAKLKGELKIHYHSADWEVIMTTPVSRDEQSGFYWSNTRCVDQHSFEVEEYGALPEGRLTDTIDRLQDVASVKEALDTAGREKVAYELLDSIAGYADPEGNTAEVFGLNEGSTFDSYRTLLDTEVQGRKEKIDDGFFGKIPLIGKYIKDRQLAKVEVLRERKADIIDQLEGSLVKEA
ncbi:MAG: hypothetical protein QF415_16125 [Candidatus Undinarchaeales archaeon]|jgi:hypothetical protein|nr:hypothetical protein [Candidatus Undinarchaeales archaeon]MDP7492366.1 hypothetical protein [Candidatus Undinarchaeales archaeon]